MKSKKEVEEEKAIDAYLSKLMPALTRAANEVIAEHSKGSKKKVGVTASKKRIK